MAGMAVEKGELREHAVTSAPGVEQDVDLRCHRHCLPDGPDLDTIEIALAAHIVRIDLEMRRLQVGEGLHLETHARMSGRHDAVRDVFVAGAEVTGQA